jgi:hypothetical protein
MLINQKAPTIDSIAGGRETDVRDNQGRARAGDAFFAYI